MKVLLVYPAWPKNSWPQGWFRSYWVPTGLAHIARILESGGCEVRVHVCEEHLVKNGLDRSRAEAVLRKELKDFKPQIVGLSVLTPGMIEAASIARLAREICGGDTMIVAGGVHPTALPERTLNECPELDAVVLGEGEWTMLDLAERGLDENVPGVVFRRGSDLVRTAPRPAEKNLDRLGMPAYHLFDMAFYTSPNRWMIPWLKLRSTNIRTSRGCRGTCNFCAGPLVSGPGVRFHSVDHVINQIDYVRKNFGIEAVHFEDDSVGADLDRLMRLCQELRQSGLNRHIRWDCCLRVDQATREILSEMKSAGCIMVEYGFETGSEQLLKNIGKRSSMELNRRAVELTRKVGLRIYADIMVGLPGENEKDWEATSRFLRWARPEIISAALLYPLPGTRLFKSLPQEVRQSVRWEDYTYYNSVKPDLLLSSLPLEAIQRLYRRFDRYQIKPHTAWAILRDSDPEERALRRGIWKYLISFALRHPIHALRTPW